MRYLHEFIVRAPQAAVARFHAGTGSMAAITPPPVIVRIHRAPITVSEGETMDFTLWLGPIPVRWLARFQEVTEQGFTDSQEHGPFQSWSHQHRFMALDEQTTLVRDEITLELRRQSWWLLVGALMRLNLPVLFAYRAWQTRRLLEGA